MAPRHCMPQMSHPPLRPDRRTGQQSERACGESKCAGRVLVSAHRDASNQTTASTPLAVKSAVPTPSRGYVWAPGYWAAWNSHQHVWHSDARMKERRGHVYTQPAWVEHDCR